MFGSINASTKRGMAMAMEVKAMQDRQKAKAAKAAKEGGGSVNDSSPTINHKDLSSKKQHRSIFGRKNKNKGDDKAPERDQQHPSDDTVTTSSSVSTVASKKSQTQPETNRKTTHGHTERPVKSVQVPASASLFTMENDEIPPGMDQASVPNPNSYGVPSSRPSNSAAFKRPEPEMSEYCPEDVASDFFHKEERLPHVHLTPAHHDSPHTTTPPETPKDVKLVQAQQTLKLIQDTIASQEARDDHLGQEIVALQQDARQKLALQNKRGAIRHLKKMKLKQYEQNKINHAIETMEAQVLTIESAIESAKVLKAMQQGANTMKSFQHGKESNVEFVDSVFSDIKDTMDYADEIQQILAEPVANVVMDEDELLQELADSMDTTSNTTTPTSRPAAVITTMMDIDNLPALAPSMANPATHGCSNVERRPLNE